MTANASTFVDRVPAYDIIGGLVGDPNADAVGVNPILCGMSRHPFDRGEDF